jgi:aryl sulfotransferase
MAPAQPREFRNHVMDSTRWNDFRFRDGDIVIASWGKSGTTWMQQIVGQLVFDGADDVPIHKLSPWVDFRLPSRKALMRQLEAQPHRRFVKTHLPADALAFSSQAKYLFLARDARDVAWSAHAHQLKMDSNWVLRQAMRILGGPRERVDPDIRRYYHTWLDRDGYPAWPFWPHIQSWWDLRKLPNVRLVHFANLKADLPREIRRIARFLDFAIDEARMPRIVEHCGFDFMKRSQGGDPRTGALINVGSNGRWRDVLSPDEIAKCDRIAAANLTPDCAHWLRTGEYPDGPDA